MCPWRSTGSTVTSDKNQSRPLLMRDDKETAVRELMAARTPLYAAAADFTVDADGDAFSVARAIQKALKL